MKKFLMIIAAMSLFGTTMLNAQSRDTAEDEKKVTSAFLCWFNYLKQSLLLSLHNLWKLPCTLCLNMSITLFITPCLK